MLRLKANKTSLYKLVSDYEGGLPPTQQVTFIEAESSSEYWLTWRETNPDGGLKCQAFFAVSAGEPLLLVSRRGLGCGPERYRKVHRLTLDDLQGRGMVEEFVTAEECRRMEGRQQ